MSRNSQIEWCHHTVNFWWGCTKVSPACRLCYAESWAKFTSHGKATWGEKGLRWLRIEQAQKELRSLDASARRRGVRERVFINSMSDTFEERSDLAAARNALFVTAEKLTNLDLLLLTKRPENVVPMLEKIRVHWCAESLPLFPHIWIGTTVEDQRNANLRIPELMKIPAAVRFLSCEPLLGELDLGRFLWDYGYERMWPKRGSEALHWVICGGESGKGIGAEKPKPMRAEWVQDLRDQCATAGVPFHFKQWGEWIPSRQAIRSGIIGTLPDRAIVNAKALGDDQVLPAGKKASGRLLDGVAHDGFPNTNIEAKAA